MEEKLRDIRLSEERVAMETGSFNPIRVRQTLRIQLIQLKRWEG